MIYWGSKTTYQLPSFLDSKHMALWSHNKCNIQQQQQKFLVALVLKVTIGCIIFFFNVKSAWPNDKGGVLFIVYDIW